MSDLPHTIRARRKELGLTLEDVATAVGVTPGALSHIESGRRLPDPRNAVGIAQALQMDPQELLVLLDEAHSNRRADRSGWNVNEDANPMRSSAVFSALPISAMFSRPDEGEPDVVATRARARDVSPQGVRSNVGSASPRDRARWAPDSGDRLRAAEELAEDASRALRTLRGMLADPDPAVSQEARRLLLELGVKGEG